MFQLLGILDFYFIYMQIKDWKWSSCTNDSGFQKPDKKAMKYCGVHNKCNLVEEFADYSFYDP